jgi:hypothetical protein
LVPLARFGTEGLRRRDLTDALEHPRMALPGAQEVHRSGLKWQVGSGPVGARPMSALGQKRTLCPLFAQLYGF